MTCTYDREILALYVNDDATPEERHGAEAHLGECSQCRGVVAEYRLGARVLSTTFIDAAPGHRRRSKLPPRPLRRIAVAAMVLIGLLGVIQVPAVAAQLTRVLPFLTVLEMDGAGMAEFLQRFSEDRPTKVFYPDYYETLEAAEEAWGGPIPRPAALPEGITVHKIAMYRRENGFKDVTIHYNAPAGYSAVGWHLSTRPQQRMVPLGATSEVKVNGKPAVVIGGTFARRPGGPLKWEAKSDTHLFFPVGDLYGDIFTVGEDPDFSLEDLIRFAESVR